MRSERVALAEIGASRNRVGGVIQLVLFAEYVGESQDGDEQISASSTCPQR
jgi:hypothetical protein